MRRFIMLAILVSLILFPLGTYVYLRGCIDGVARYKKSTNFLYTLNSAYMYGVRDGSKNCGENK